MWRSVTDVRSFSRRSLVTQSRPPPAELLPAEPLLPKNRARRYRIPKGCLLSIVNEQLSQVPKNKLCIACFPVLPIAGLDRRP